MTTLPTIQLFDETYFVDKRLREMRNIKDPHDSISFDDFETSLKLAAINIRQNGGTDKHLELWGRLHKQARDYDRAVGNEPSERFTEIAMDDETPSPTRTRSRRSGL